ncbi:Protein of unknown function [Pyronema omphalodes CBS 100304]|uniref:Uncharacterized protein n=1 Tax=Pyronema omphalodes (strain CBS 100304) TaxID=1076935 RepID=U4L1Z9_PYROM|nr:Protein of unknown function [Pyronema omphalodes CBS 100304]
MAVLTCNHKMKKRNGNVVYYSESCITAVINVAAVLIAIAFLVGAIT